MKFTGGKGFHIGIPFEAFPRRINNRPINLLYPELPRSIIEYLKHTIKEELKERILELYTLKEVAEFVGKTQEELLTKNEFDPFKAVNLDSAIISSRHLFRMPYSLHEKNHLVSLPVKDIDKFQKEDASIKNFKGCELDFFKKTSRIEAATLVIEALDFARGIELPVKKMEKRERKGKRFGKEYFPPCIKKLLEGGMSDGRKRGLFILITFLRQAGWSWEEIEAEINEWNKKNKPLPARYINSQLKWFKQQKKDLLPPNCDHQFYKDLGICFRDEMDENIKNPINYLHRKNVGS